MWESLIDSTDPSTLNVGAVEFLLAHMPCTSGSFAPAAARCTGATQPKENAVNRHVSLAAYHERKRVEAELALEQLRSSRAIAPYSSDSGCSRPHVGPVVGTLAVLGGLVLLGALLGSRDHE